MIRYSERPVPTTGGHYSHCVSAGDFAFISGQLPILSDGTHALGSASFEDQFRQTLANLEKALVANDLTTADLVKVTIYVADIADWSSCNALYTAFMGDLKPARTIVPVGPLHFGFLVELDAVAFRTAAGA